MINITKQKLVTVLEAHAAEKSGALGGMGTRTKCICGFISDGYSMENHIADKLMELDITIPAEEKE